ncbi:Actin-depolymerizing factor 1, isoforms a/b [Aphelenchoides bicaudatus]|nr:Actin-depolymerizing factor 1, isoforms a/b [Aphelenchoides bicaudatus]
MSSGVNVHADCQSTFQQLSEGKRTLRYIIYKIDGKEVVVEAAVSQEDIGISGDDHEENSKTAYEHFVKDLKERTGDYSDCRYAVFDFKFTCVRPGAGNSKVDKIIFFQLCPDGASIKKKMVYASSASAIKAALGTAKFLQIQASEEAEIEHQEVLSRMMARMF